MNKEQIFFKAFNLLTIFSEIIILLSSHQGEGSDNQMHQLSF